jgi:hypothetical protein
MLRRHARLVVIIGVAVVLVVAIFRLSPLWPGPSLPAGAVRLRLATEPAHLLPALGCPAAALAPARIAVSSDELILLSASNDERVKVIWPSGWAAWRVAGRAELVSRDGTLIGHEGDLIEGFGGGVGIDGAFHVCEIGA